MSLVELATACSSAFDAYSAAKQKANDSAAQAMADAGAADHAHGDLRSAIQALVSAAQAEDPAAPAPAPAS